MCSCEKEMHKFQKQGGAGSEPERNGREWSRVEREICSAASEHACGLQTAAGEGHRRSLLSCSPLGWGRLGRSVGDTNSKICAHFWPRPKGTQIWPRAPNFEKNFSKLWPVARSGPVSGRWVAAGPLRRPRGVLLPEGRISILPAGAWRISEVRSHSSRSTTRSKGEKRRENEHHP